MLSPKALRAVTYRQMAAIVYDIRCEVKKRNPLWANMWDGELWKAQHALNQIADAKKAQPGYDEYSDKERRSKK